MKRIIPFLMVALLGLSACNGTNNPVDTTSTEEKLSYGLGLQAGNKFKQQNMAIDINAYYQGLQHGMTGAKPLLTDDELREVFQEYQKQQIAHMTEMRKQRKAQAEENKGKSEEYMKEAKAKGLQETPDGVLYKVLTAGGGIQPKPDSKVRVHYRGRLTDGTEFDSSYKRGTPAEFPLKGVIPGWSKTLPLMKEGAKWELTIPPQMAYGPGGQGPIPPNSVLIFEVELLKVL